MATTSERPPADEHDRLSELFDTQIRQQPDKAAQVLLEMHLEDPGYARYLFVESLRLVLVDGDGTAGSTLHSACTTGLSQTLLKILLDDRVYIRDPSSELDHPRLQVST